MASWNFFHSFLADKYNGVHNLSSNTLRWVLSNTAPNYATHDELADITQIANGNGYTTGGVTWTGVTSSQTSGVYTLDGNNVSWTSSGSGMATFRYAILYNDTSSGDRLIGCIDYGVGLSYAVGQTHTIEFASTGLITETV